MTVVGFDFGTTNSLISVIRGERPISYLDDEQRPFTVADGLALGLVEALEDPLLGGGRNGGGRAHGFELTPIDVPVHGQR